VSGANSGWASSAVRVAFNNGVARVSTPVTAQRAATPAALRHSGVHHGTKVVIDWVDSESVGSREVDELLRAADGIIVPGGFGGRGFEGKIAVRELIELVAEAMELDAVPEPVAA